MIEEHKTQIMRSLLQKGVRRGDPELVEKVFDYLIKDGDLSWVKQRLSVITAEECWPLLFEISDKSNIRKVKDMFLRVTESEKYKGAAGIASYASRVADKGHSQKVYGTKQEKELVQITAEFILKPEDYWEKLKSKAKKENKEHLYFTVKELSKSASFETDKAMFFVAGLLAVNFGIPKITIPNKISPQEEFPYWIAIDKHTELGRVLIREFAMNHKDYTSFEGMEFYLKKYQFYFEGSKVNHLADERLWKLNVLSDLVRMKRTESDAEEEWEKYKPELIKYLEKYTDEIKDESNNKSAEPDLFG